LWAIERDNPEFFESFRQFVQRGITARGASPHALVVPHYLPGNHDRLTFEILRPVLRDIVENVGNDAFFVEKVAGLAHGLLAPAAHPTTPCPGQ
jgi:hypothetical protein